MTKLPDILVLLLSVIMPTTISATTTDSITADTATKDSVTAVVAEGLSGPAVEAAEADSVELFAEGPVVEVTETDSVAADIPVESLFGDADLYGRRERLTLYDFPYSRTRSMPMWNRLWVNTAILMGAGVTTMCVLEALPADATAWNKSENSKVPLFKRWWRHVHEGPVWDHDNLVFNYVLHPYAGAAYYMGARSNGFNMWGSLLYSFCISTFFWEYGFEAFNEIPSIQDIIITPVVGAILGEGFYLTKRHIVNNGYRLFGSKVLGYVVAFLVDPLNELTGYFRGDQRKLARRADMRRQAKEGGFDISTWVAPSSNHGLQGGFTISYTF